MSTGAIIGIIIAVIVVAAVVVVASAQLRRSRMRRQFGPEYDRLAKEIGPRKADAELTARQRRVDALDIRPLPAERQAKYSGDWAVVQERFVDAPASAVSDADTLIWAVMRDRGYPADDRTASVEALSVNHARSLDGYRQSQDLRTDAATTEQLREALIRYRALFEDLTGLRESPTHATETGVAETGVAATGVAATGVAATGVAANGVAANGGPVTEDSDLATDDGELAAENTDRTAETPR
jgi:hypothetical protein